MICHKILFLIYYSVRGHFFVVPVWIHFFFYFQSFPSLCLLHWFYLLHWLYYIQVLNSYIHFITKFFTVCPHFYKEFINFITLFVHIFLCLFKRFIHFFFNSIYHLHTGIFKVFFLCFSYVKIFRVSFGRIAGLQWRHIALDVIDCVFMLESIHLVLMIIGLDADFWFCLC